MNPIERIIITARRRLFFQAWIAALGWLLLSSCTVTIGLLLSKRLLTLAPPLWMYPTVVAIALVIAPVVAWRKRPSRQAVAVMIDRRLGLKDQLGSALFASSFTIDNPFAHQVVSNANQTAASLPLARVFPIGLGRVWRYVPISALTVALLAVFLPQMDLVGLAKSRAQKQARLNESQTAQEQVNQAVTAVERITLPNHGLDKDAPAIDPKDLSDQLSQITQSDLSNPTARRQAAAELSNLQENLTDQKQQKQQLLQMLENTMSRLDRPVQGPADPFTDAMRRSDFQTAQKAIDDLVQTIESMPAQDRRALSRQLSNLAQQLQRASEQHAQQENQIQQQIQQTMREDQSVDPQTQTGQPPPGPQAQQSQDKRQATGSQDLQQIAQMKKAQEQAGRNHKYSEQVCKDLSKSLDQLGKSISDQPSDQTKNGPPQQPSHAQPLEQLYRRLGQIAQLDKQLEQMRQAQDKTRQAIESLCQQPDQPGRADGDNPLGQQRQMPLGQTYAAGDFDQTAMPEAGQLWSWRSKGQNTPGQPTTDFDHAITQAKQQAEQAVSDDRVPGRYHETVRRYFNQLSTDQTTTPPAPPTKAPDVDDAE